MLNFSCDYLDGAHPKVLEAIARANFVKTGCYGAGDVFCDAATQRIRTLCEAPEAEVHYLGGGTQTNMVVLTTLLRPWEGVIASKSGHISIHEAGAIEAGGHKVMTVENRDGKLDAATVEREILLWKGDGNREHMVEPGVVFVTLATEYGTNYTLAELEAISEAAHRHGVKLYLDGARIFYGLAAEDCDVTLADVARLADAFYIGGTKCGLLFGEAVVFPRPGLIPHFYTLTKQLGAMFAKSKVLGAQFDALLTDGLGLEIARHANREADRIRARLAERGYEVLFGGRTNQVFVRLTDAESAKLSESVAMSFWERTDDAHAVWRIATSWSTDPKDVDALLELL